MQRSLGRKAGKLPTTEPSKLSPSKECPPLLCRPHSNRHDYLSPDSVLICRLPNVMARQMCQSSTLSTVCFLHAHSELLPIHLYRSSVTLCNKGYNESIKTFSQSKRGELKEKTLEIPWRELVIASIVQKTTKLKTIVVFSLKAECIGTPLLRS